MKSKDKDEQTRYQNQFAWELARHSVAEEIVVYPAMQKLIQDGQEMADKDRMEHQEVRKRACQLLATVTDMGSILMSK